MGGGAAGVSVPVGDDGGARVAVDVCVGDAVDGWVGNCVEMVVVEGEDASVRLGVPVRDGAGVGVCEGVLVEVDDGARVRLAVSVGEGVGGGVRVTVDGGLGDGVGAVAVRVKVGVVLAGGVGERVVVGVDAGGSGGVAVAVAPARTTNESVVADARSPEVK